MEAGSMTDWITSYVGVEYAQTINYAIWGLAALIGLLLLWWLIRKFSHGTFISGGRNAQPRLAVLDAAPVDSHRRLVLVRRDDVEHLLLIGGNTDIVVEPNIRPFGAPARPVREAEPARERPAAVEPQPYPAQRPVQPAPPRPMASVQPLRPVAPAAPVQRFEPQPAAPAPVAPAVRTETPMQMQNYRVEPQAPAPAPQPGETAPVKNTDLSVDDELEKMLSDFGGYTPQKT
jgi:Flagellar biosynthesis protein, FliO